MNIRTLLTKLVIVLIFHAFPLKAFSQTESIKVADKFGNELRVLLNAGTGSPHRIKYLDATVERYGYSMESLSPGNVGAFGIELLADYEEILGVSASNFQLRYARLSHKGKWHLSYQQFYRGIPVYRAKIGFTVEAGGAIRRIGAVIHPNINEDVSPSITPEDAVRAATSKFGVDGVETISIKESPSLVIYPRKEAKGFRYFLAYKLRLFSLRPLKEWSYFVDASTGKIVYSVNDMVDAVNEGYVRKQHYPEHWHDTPVVDGTYVDKHVEITNLLGQHIVHDFSDANGWYTMTWSGAVGSYNIRVLSPPAHSTNWITIENQWDDVWISNTSLRYDFWTDETNVLYHADWIHGFYSGAPFNYTGMDYQMKANMHYGSGTNGSSDGVDIAFGSENGELWARSSDLVYHEYTHNVIYHLYGSSFIGDEQGGQGDAMDEGLSDYYACTINDDPIWGESVNVFRNLSNSLSFDEDLDKHVNGQVIGGAVWDMRQSPGIGISLADELLFDALGLTPQAHDFANLLDNIIYADNGGARLSEGSPHLDDILYAFENHLIYPFDDEVPPAKPKNLDQTASSGNPVIEWDASDAASGVYLYRLQAGDYVETKKIILLK